MKKNHNLRWFFLGVLTTLAVLIGGTAIYFSIPSRTESVSPISLATIKKLIQMERVVKNNFLNETDAESLTNGILNGYVAGLDDTYAAYYTSEEYEDITLSNNGQTLGIGASISKDESTGYMRVVAVQEDSPTENAGITVGDFITSVDGQSVVDLSSSDVVELIQGSASEEVVLGVLHEGSENEEELQLTKAAVDREVVRYAMTDEKIGYIYISSFNRLTAEQFEEAYEELHTDGMQALIIDLRGNRGGLVEACCNTLRLFMPEGVLVYEADRDGKETVQECAGDNAIQLPLVLLVNAGTASASEMFTGAVKDHGVGYVIGTTTYGKGIEQKSYTFRDGSVLKLTTTRYYTPDHIDINGTGIEPDLEVEADESGESDSQIDAAIRYLLEQI